MKQLLIATVCFIWFGTQAQTEKGTLQFGLGGFPVIYSDSSLPTGYSLRANVGYFLTKDIVVGLVPYAGNIESIRSRGAGIYARYYQYYKRLSFFAEVGVGLGTITYEESPQFNGTMSSFAIGPGIGYAITRQIAIELLPQYARLENVSNPDATTIGRPLLVTVGFQYFISN